MKINFLSTALLLLTVSFSGVSLAESESHMAITKSLKSVFPGTAPTEISPSPMAGVSEVLIGPRLFYITNDGKYLLQGSLIEIATRKDISEERRNGIRQSAIDELGEENMIVFPAKDSRHTISVFTDIDCGYCRKLHNEVKKYNKLGIRVRYMAYPRAGIGSAAFQKAEAVWCSKDRAKAMTQAKGGAAVKAEKCKNPVAEHYGLGNLIGISGTPAIVLEDGTVVPGYIPASRLSAALNDVKK